MIVSAKSEGKKVEAHWTFGIEEGAAGGGSASGANTEEINGDASRLPAERRQLAATIAWSRSRHFRQPPDGSPVLDRQHA